MEMQQVLAFKTWRAEDKRTIVATDERQHEALGRPVIVFRAIEKRLEQLERGVMIQVIYEFHVAFKKLGDFSIQRLQTVALGLRLQQLIDFCQRFRKLERVRAIALRPVPKRLDFIR